MKITKIVGREIYDSRGWPTVQCELEIDNEIWVTAATPTGLSRGKHEAFELRDGGKRLWGRGVLRAIEHIEYVIAPALTGQEVDGPALDGILLELDGTKNKSHLGANAILPVSIAVHRAHAVQDGIELFELIAQLLGLNTVTMPFPQVNLINGGLHADNKLPLQETLLVPIGVHHFRSAIELAASTFHELQGLLQRHNKRTCIGDEGGYAPHLSIDEALLSVCEAMQRTSVDEENRSVIAIDMAATQLFDHETGRYKINDEEFTSSELIEWYSKLIELYPIYSIEDPMAEDDWNGWKLCMEQIGDKVQIVADDLCVTNVERITRGIQEHCMSAVIIKPNQVGTVTETLAAVQLCRENNLNTIISHRSGETNDVFIADLAVGASAGQIKTGGCCRGERVAKYNRLLAIEDSLFWGILNRE